MLGSELTTNQVMVQSAAQDCNQRAISSILNENITVSLSAVHPHACPLWSLPLYGCGLAQWSTGEPGIFLEFPSIHVLTFLLWEFPLTLYFAAHSVHGPPEAASDACQAPARPDLPAACATTQSSPLHLRPAAVPGSAVDPQVHRGCHHLPCHGEFIVQFSLCLSLAVNFRGDLL